MLHLSSTFFQSTLTRPVQWDQTSRRQRQVYRFARQFLAWGREQKEEFFRRHGISTALEGHNWRESGVESEEEDEEEEERDVDLEDEIDTLDLTRRVLKTLKDEKLTLKGLSEALDVSRNILSSLLRTPLARPQAGSKPRNIYKSLQGWLALDVKARGEFTRPIGAGPAISSPSPSSSSYNDVQMMGPAEEVEVQQPQQLSRIMMMPPQAPPAAPFLWQKETAMPTPQVMPTASSASLLPAMLPTVPLPPQQMGHRLQFDSERERLLERCQQLSEQRQGLASQLEAKRSRLMELVEMQEHLSKEHESLTETQRHYYLTQREDPSVALKICENAASPTSLPDRNVVLSSKQLKQVSSQVSQVQLTGFAPPDPTLDVNAVSKGILEHIKGGLLTMDMLAVTLRINRYTTNYRTYTVHVLVHCMVPALCNFIWHNCVLQKLPIFLTASAY